MNEIEILYQFTAPLKTIPTSVFITIFIILSVVCFVSMLAYLVEESKTVGNIFFAITLLLFVSLIVLGSINSELKTNKSTFYEVRITDEKYTLDAQKYAYVSQRGDIITIKEIPQK